MAKIIRECPKCGNHVEGVIEQTFLRKVTRGAFQKGAGTVTFAIIGSVVPGAGTSVGAAVGQGVDIILNATMSDKVTQFANWVSNKMFGKADVNFNCPKCGLLWKVPSAQLQLEYVSNMPNGEGEDNPFFTIWNDYFESKAELFANRNALKHYIDHIDTLHDENLNEESAASYLFLQAFAILQYRIETDDSYYLKWGNKFLSRARAIFDDTEFQIMQDIYNIYLMDSDSPSALEEIKKLPEMLQVETLDNNYVAVEYWEEIYRSSWLYRALQTGVRLYDKGEEEDAYDLLFLVEDKLTDADPPGWDVICACYESDYYSKCEDFQSEADYYAKYAVEKVYDTIDIDFNPNDFADRCWLKCLETAGISYIEGEAYDFAKGFLYLTKAANLGSVEAMSALGDYYLDGEYGFAQDSAKALEWHIKASNQGDPYSAYRVAEMYEEGNGVAQNFEYAIQWYTKAKENGYDELYANPTWERIENIEQIKETKI